MWQLEPRDRGKIRVVERTEDNEEVEQKYKRGPEVFIYQGHQFDSIVTDSLKDGIIGTVAQFVLVSQERIIKRAECPRTQPL